jgi:hypothetical protein
MMWWISFVVEDECVGCCIVDAQTEEQALGAAALHDCLPRVQRTTLCYASMQRIDQAKLSAEELALHLASRNRLITPEEAFARFPVEERDMPASERGVLH